MYNKKIDDRKGLKYWYCFKYLGLQFLSEIPAALLEAFLELLNYLYQIIVGLIFLIFFPIILPITAFYRWRATIKYYENLDKKE